jgi:DNA-directed RNA polymerase specialized sigma24 family protein
MAPTIQAIGTMPGENDGNRLSGVSTAWTILFQAHGSGVELARGARRELLQRSGDPVYRYLRASVRDAEAASELYQEFALKFVRGDFKRADPERGRFRDFLKTALFHLVAAYHHRRGRQAEPLAAESALPAASVAATDSADADFVAAWREELSARAWTALATWEEETGQLLRTVLRMRGDHPDLPSSELAQRLAQDLGKPITASWVRNRLHFAREKVTKFLLDDVRLTLGTASDEELAEDLLDLGLLDYCRPVLQKSAGQS